jgi:ferric-dicitrate binding protein FerR (iron transport regulator)
MLSQDCVLSVPTTEQMDEATRWAEGRLVIANRTLRDALPTFRRWYLMDLRPEVMLLDRTFSMSAPIDNGESALVALERAAHVKRIWMKQQMVLVDAPAAPAPTRRK